MTTDKTFYFFLDYKKTKAAVKAKIDQYNKDLELLFTHNPSEFRKSKGLGVKQTYKACTIKSSEETSLFAMLEIYGGWLHRNSFIKLQPQEFRANNKALATQKNNHISERTCIRHIKKLQDANIIVDKNFRGTKASFGLKFCPDLIHFKPNQEYNFYLADLYKEFLNGVEVKPQAFKEIYSFSGTLRNFPLGCQVTSCRLNSTSILLLVHKINMECGIVNNDFCLRTESFSKNRIDNDFLLKKNENMERQNACHDENTPPVAPPPPAAAEAAADPLHLKEDLKRNKHLSQQLTTAKNHKDKGTQPLSEHEKIWKEVFTFYCYAVAILWPDRVITEYERNRVCNEIFKHYKNLIGEKDVYPTVYGFRGEFMFRILLSKKYVKNNPIGFIPGPINYFDFENKAGFNGTEPWVEPSKEMEKQNKLYLQHYKIFIKAWKNFTKEPDVPTYNIAIQQLGKLKNDCWITYFNQAAANLNQFSITAVQKIWKQNYQAN